MLIKTQWTLSWGGVSLLLPTDMTEGELKLPSGAGVYQEVRPVRGDYVIRIGRGNVSQSMSFRRQVRCANAAAARIFALVHLDALGTVASKQGTAPDATLQPITGGAWLLKSCKVTWAPDIILDRFVCDYRLECGDLVLQAAPPDPDPPLAPDTKVTDTGDTKVTDSGDTKITID